MLPLMKQSFRVRAKSAMFNGSTSFSIDDSEVKIP